MLRPLRTRMPVLFALVLTAVALLPPSGWALCVAPGGHVEVEPVADSGGCCTTPVAVPATEDVASADGDCDACTDVTAFAGPVSHGRAPELALPVLVVPCAFARAAGLQAGRTASPAPAVPAPGTAASQRAGTVLRI